MEIRPPREPPVQIDKTGTPHQVLVRHVPNDLKSTVFAIVTIIAHEEVVIRRDGPRKINDPAILGQHDRVLRATELLGFELRTSKAKVALVSTIRGDWQFLAVNKDVVVMYDDAIARQSDAALYQKDRMIRR